MQTVAVIFGGKSAEHDVSIVTAIGSVIKPLELTRKYRVEAIYIAKNGAWYWDDRLKNIKLYSSDKIKDFLQKTKPVRLQFDGGLMLVKPSGITGRKKTIKIDVVFPATHGTYGEDGSLMGLLRMANVPFVGCDMESSVLAMNKLLSHQIVKDYGVESHALLGVTKAEFERDPSGTTERLEKLGYPLFSKPVHLGSSIGISKVANRQELKNALEVVFHYDDTGIVEATVPNLIEVTVPVMGNHEPVAAMVEQPLTTSQDFFDFDTKYLQGGKKGKAGSAAGGERGAQGYSKIPADLPPELYKKAEDTALAVYKALGCSGIARVDLLIDSKAQKVYFNEVNPMPGSLYAHNWRAAGVSGVELVEKLIRLAEQRWHDQQRNATVFTTNYLKQF